MKDRKAGALHFTGVQRVGHGLGTEQPKPNEGQCERTQSCIVLDNCWGRKPLKGVGGTLGSETHRPTF